MPNLSPARTESFFKAAIFTSHGLSFILITVLLRIQSALAAKRVLGPPCATYSSVALRMLEYGPECSKFRWRGSYPCVNGDSTGQAKKEWGRLRCGEQMETAHTRVGSSGRRLAQVVGDRCASTIAAA